MAEIKRIFIGELFDGITKSDLLQRFSRFGKIIDVEIRVKKDEAGKPIKTFAFVEMEIDDKGLKSCVYLLNKTKWKSKMLSVEIAKECFYHKLLKQIAEQKSEVKEKEIIKSENIKNRDIKSAVPGTKVPGLRKWVISKYGRALPIVYIRRKDKSKYFAIEIEEKSSLFGRKIAYFSILYEELLIMMVDPSKYCHNIKQFKEETSPKKAKKKEAPPTLYKRKTS